MLVSWLTLTTRFNFLLLKSTGHVVLNTSKKVKIKILKNCVEHTSINFLRLAQ